MAEGGANMADWELDGADEGGFGEAVAALFEQAPRFIERLKAARPLGSWEALFSAGVTVALEMPEDEQIELIDAHPRIGAPPGSVSALSFVEQGYDAEAAGAEAEAERQRIASELDRLNSAYEARFGFRYVIFVAGRPRAEIVPMMEAALDRERAAEMERALRDVVAIGRDRAIKTGLMAHHAPDTTG
jgi:2-oxo-4-hydroxy-4-carboxy-5-ureidoimidazoline decarboxylase